MSANVPQNRAITLRYFAWVRERIGRSEELLTLPAQIVTIDDLIVWLRTRGPEYELAFSKPDVIRIAIDHTHAKSSAKIGTAREIGFFPPVTGG